MGSQNALIKKKKTFSVSNYKYFLNINFWFISKTKYLQFLFNNIIKITSEIQAL